MSEYENYINEKQYKKDTESTLRCCPFCRSRMEFDLELPKGDRYRSEVRNIVLKCSNEACGFVASFGENHTMSTWNDDYEVRRRTETYHSLAERWNNQ